MNEIIQSNSRFRYCLLGRLMQDCEYYLGYGNRQKSRLWAGDEKKQIEIMIELHNSFPETEKPVWLTMDEIKLYQSKMIIPEQ